MASMSGIRLARCGSCATCALRSDEAVHRPVHAARRLEQTRAAIVRDGAPLRGNSRTETETKLMHQQISYGPKSVTTERSAVLAVSSRTGRISTPARIEARPLRRRNSGQLLARTRAARAL